ncbi:DUF6053 domain-containing protein [Lysobacter yananisis]|uniref:DUF6053 domain-containing protein n=1 Tax=Lysobacter TaxID=68 RepID=UPI003CE52057
MGGASAPTLLAQVAMQFRATRQKSVGAEAPPTIAAAATVTFSRRRRLGPQASPMPPNPGARRMRSPAHRRPAGRRTR